MELFDRQNSSSSSTTTAEYLSAVIPEAEAARQVSGLFSTQDDLLHCCSSVGLPVSAFRDSNSLGSCKSLEQAPQETHSKDRDSVSAAVSRVDPVVVRILKRGPCCRVRSCGAELSEAKEYHRRHRVCEEHAKAPLVVVDALEQRFCQQCSRFQMVGEFDNAKRSCRRRLAIHNERRRKSSQETVALVATVLEERWRSSGAGSYLPHMAPVEWMRCPNNNNNITAKGLQPDSPLLLHLHGYHLSASEEETLAFLSNPTGLPYDSSSLLFPNSYTANLALLAETVPGRALSLLSPPLTDVNHQTPFPERPFNLNHSFYYPLPLATASISSDTAAAATTTTTTTTTTTPAWFIDNSAGLGDAASSGAHCPLFLTTTPRGIMAWPPFT